MSIILSMCTTGLKSFSYLLGASVIALAVGVYFSSLHVIDIAAWALQVFGISFLTLLTVLVFTVLFSWSRLLQLAHDPARRKFWLELGLHAANGIATLALTFTLLGISLGINTLSGQELNADTVQAIISEMTRHFSLAFLTTVVGLPTSACLRALVLLTETRVDTANVAILSKSWSDWK